MGVLRDYRRAVYGVCVSGGLCTGIFVAATGCLAQSLVKAETMLRFYDVRHALSIVDIAKLPFNQLIGLELADPESGFLVTLPGKPQYTNHLGTVHGSALLAVAEAGSGEFLVRQLGDIKGVIPVVRKLEAKFRKPATGRVSSRCLITQGVVACWVDELISRGRLSASIPVEVVDAKGIVVMFAIVEWFISTGNVNA